MPAACVASIVAFRRGGDVPFAVLALIVSAVEAVGWVFFVSGAVTG
ncbi:MAG: hypothetical protein AB7Q17_05860 [Phycisphaerae bacterium]